MSKFLTDTSAKIHVEAGNLHLLYKLNLNVAPPKDMPIMNSGTHIGANRKAMDRLHDQVVDVMSSITKEGNWKAEGYLKELSQKNTISSNPQGYEGKEVVGYRVDSLESGSYFGFAGKVIRVRDLKPEAKESYNHDYVATIMSSEGKLSDIRVWNTQVIYSK